MSIPFTDRELKNAWRELSKISLPAMNNVRSNPHRLLLFYAVECGLKAVWLKRKNSSLFDSEDIQSSGHDLRKVLKDLRVGGDLDLPQSLQLSPVTQGTNSIPRTGSISILHQAWRYGGQSKTPTDIDCETYLQNVLNWIEGELK